MEPKVSEGHIILRQWDSQNGLSEVPYAFHSLDELYARCLAAGDPQLVDRLVIRGRDEKGEARVLTFVFQSITISTKK